MTPLIGLLFSGPCSQAFDPLSFPRNGREGVQGLLSIVSATPPGPRRTAAVRSAAAPV